MVPKNDKKALLGTILIVFFEESGRKREEMCNFVAEKFKWLTCGFAVFL